MLPDFGAGELKKRVLPSSRPPGAGSLGRGRHRVRYDSCRVDNPIKTGVKADDHAKHESDEWRLQQAGFCQECGGFGGGSCTGSGTRLSGFRGRELEVARQIPDARVRGSSEPDRS